MILFLLGLAVGWIQAYLVFDWNRGPHLYIRVEEEKKS